MKAFFLLLALPLASIAHEPAVKVGDSTTVTPEINWNCVSEVDDEFLPAFCKDN